MREPPMPHIGKGVALAAQVAPPVYSRVYSHLSSFYATLSDQLQDLTYQELLMLISWLTSFLYKGDRLFN